MILPTNIEPATRGTRFGEVPNGVTASGTEPTIESSKVGERWLAVVGSEYAQSQYVSFFGGFAKDDAEIHLAELSRPNPAHEVRRLAIALEVDWLCIVAERGVGPMSLFLRSDVEGILRAAPCPVICIPELSSATGERQSPNQKANPIRRILVPIKFPLRNRVQVKNAIALAQRFEAKLDLLGVDELLRDPEGLRTFSSREAKRLQIQAIKKKLSNLADELVPNRMRGRLLVSVGFPLFYATPRWARELNSHLVVLAAPSRLWISEGRVDGGTERILHRVGCPVICIPDHGELGTRRHKILAPLRHCRKCRDWHTPSRLTLNRGFRPVPRCKNLNGTRYELFASTIN